MGGNKRTEEASKGKMTDSIWNLVRTSTCRSSGKTWDVFKQRSNIIRTYVCLFVGCDIKYYKICAFKVKKKFTLKSFMNEGIEAGV